MTDLLAPGHLTRSTGWSLSPAPLQASIEKLEADGDRNWTSYLTPFSPKSNRNAQSYIAYYLPVKSPTRHTIDQWVRPGWTDSSKPGGPAWTNELVHFVVDNCLPLLNDIVNGEDQQRMYDIVIAAGQLQQKARSAGQQDKVIWGEGLQNSDRGFPWIIATIAITTDIKCLLPADGERWLFMRATAKTLINNRMDTEITLMDAKANVIALSNQLAQVIPTSSKIEKKSKPAKM